ncbi:UNVERIFIED_CONTAM: Inactive protein kinase SELMODRAFT [Sesamum calycinum]|uniref:Inactive protein kinase SELMODRAFT n=1 Tax=Sesamum calycinum TaxID=2727403 RepID=A0AAW2NHC1_9LAMI
MDGTDRDVGFCRLPATQLSVDSCVRPQSGYTLLDCPPKNCSWSRTRIAVGDFGLARWQPDGEKGVETRVIGTFGKADVYSFGVVLVELVTGRKAVDLNRPKGQHCLTEWVSFGTHYEAYAIDELVDPQLGSNYSENEVYCMLHAASLCIRRDPQARPRMSQVSNIWCFGYLKVMLWIQANCWDLGLMQAAGSEESGWITSYNNMNSNSGPLCITLGVIWCFLNTRIRVLCRPDLTWQIRWSCDVAFHKINSVSTELDGLNLRIACNVVDFQHIDADHMRWHVGHLLMFLQRVLGLKHDTSLSSYRPSWLSAAMVEFSGLLNFDLAHTETKQQTSNLKHILADDLG